MFDPPKISHSAITDRSQELRSPVFRTFQRRQAQGYGIGAAATLAMLLMRIYFGDLMGDRLVLVGYMVPILLGAYIGGLGPGLLATLIAAVGTGYFVAPPCLNSNSAGRSTR